MIPNRAKHTNIDLITLFRIQILCNQIRSSVIEKVILSQSAFTCSKLTIETLEEDVEYVLYC